MTLSIPISRYSLLGSNPVFMRNTGIGLLVAVLFHFAVIGTYLISENFFKEEPISMVRIKIYSPTDLPPPPPIMPDMPPSVRYSVFEKPNLGIPVPVMDADVSPDQTIPTQRDLSTMSMPNAFDNVQNGNVILENEIKIEEEPSLEAFVPVEKMPSPVRQIAPEYPEFARRAGVEGTVWVKVLVDKEGKAKKAVVIKSDADILNDAAIQAAMQWIFTPAMMNNGPVSVWAAVPFKFKLNR